MNDVGRSGALALAGLFLALALAAPIALSRDPSSTLAPAPGAGATATISPSASLPRAFEAMGHPARFAFGEIPALDPSRDSLVVSGATVGYSQDEVARVRAFLRAGGRVLVADDGGASRDLLERISVGVALSTTHVYTPAFASEPDRVLARATDVVPGLASNVPVRAPVLVEGGRAILRLPEPAWADLNVNGRPDLAEPLVSGAIAAEADVESGLLVVVGSARLVLDAEPDVLGPFLALVAPDGREIVFDEAHRGGSDPLALGALLAGETSRLVSTGILMCAGALGAAAVLAPRFRGIRKAPNRPTRARHDPALVALTLGELK